MNTRVTILVLAIGVCGLPAAARAQVPAAGDRPTVHAVYLAKGLTVDGRLDEEIYSREVPITTFVQQEPHEGEPATEKTEIWVAFDDKNLYVGGRLWDSHPERMIANEMRRDAANDIYANENLSVVLDTFHDQRSGYYFMTNMLGAMRDVQFVSEKQSNSEWNPIWNPKAQRFEQGWTVEMAIPFKSIRYPSEGEQVWGIQFRRAVRWKNEITFLTRIPAATGASAIYRLQDEATLVGLRTPAAGRNLDIKPYASSRVNTDRVVRPAVANDFKGDVGLDVKYGVTQALTTDFTYNTDFAQVEDDLQQVNLTRFGLFFPEKREFFLEGQGIFDFGGQTGSGSTPGAGDIPTMFFSRQIGLARGAAIPILGGGRLTGKAGKYSLGFVNIETKESTLVGVPSTNFGAARLRRDIFGKSYVGLIATQRSPSGGNGNTLVGADANLAFGLTTFTTYYAQTRTPGRDGENASYAATYDYAADRYGVNVQHVAVEPNFSPEMGFLRRQSFRTSAGTLRFSPRPARTNKTLKAFRKFYYQGNLSYTTNTHNELESRAAVLSVKSDLEDGGIVSASVERDYEALDAPFLIATGVRIPVGGYSFDRVAGSYQLPPTFRVRGIVSGSAGSFYSGTRSEASYAGRVEVTKQVTIEPTLSLNWVDLPAGNFKTNLISARTTYTLTPRSAFGALVQYNSSAHTVSSNVRFRWEYIPGSDLFVVYTEGRTTLIPDRFADLQNRTFIVKVTRLLRY